MPSEKRVVLSRQQIWYPCLVGTLSKMLHKYAEFEGKVNPDLGDRGGEDLDPWDQVESTCTEYAVAWFLRRNFPGDYWSKKKTIDIPPDIEVRWTKHAENGHLLIYRKDEPSTKVVMVTGKIPEYFLHGWITVEEGRKVGTYGPLRPDGRPCWQVPRTALRPIEELIIGPAEGPPRV